VTGNNPMRYIQNWNDSYSSSNIGYWTWSNYRTDRHNNPTAFTTAIAKQAWLIEWVDYEVWDAFPNNPNMKTARLLWDPIDTTIRVIDKIWFKTRWWQDRRTYTSAMWLNNDTRSKMWRVEKENAIKNMYKHEWWNGSIFSANTDWDYSYIYKDFKAWLKPQYQESFDRIPEDKKSWVMAIVNWDSLISDIVKTRWPAWTKERQDILRYAQSIDPDFSMNTNKNRVSFKKDRDKDNVRWSVWWRTSINTALWHLADLMELSKELPEWTITKMNSVKNVLNKEFGDPAVTSFRINLDALAWELAKTYKGWVPTEWEIQEWKKNLAESFSQSQFEWAFDITAKLLSSKLTSMRYLYKSTMWKEYNQSLIDPDKRQMLVNAWINPDTIIHENITWEEQPINVWFSISNNYKPNFKK